MNIRKLCLVYCFMRVTDETVQSVMLYLVRKYVINIYLVCVLLLFMLRRRRGEADKCPPRYH